jgi:hypothetical protein
MEAVRIWKKWAAILGYFAFPIRASYSKYCVLLSADFHFCGATLWKYKLPPLDDDGNIMATIGWLIGRMVPDAAPGEASAGTKGRRMRIKEASKYRSSSEISVVPFFPVPQYFSLAP